jgi:methylglutaconyl-CoA hydratase
MANELETSLAKTGILSLTLNRPEVHNAFDDLQIARLHEALEAAANDNAVRVVVLGGSGRNFSAGGDINYMRRMGNNSYEENLADAAKLAALMKRLNGLPKPTIARVNGAAMGGGVGLVSCCDYAIGTPETRFALSEVKLGMIPATISPYVVMTIGEKAARRLFMSGQSVKGAEALRMGFLSHVVEAADLDKAVEDMALRLLDNAPRAVGLAKQLAMDVAAGDINDALIQGTVKLIAEVRHSEEGREGLSAFLEKRAPAWQQS